jgi:hypothetical protein
MNYLILAYQTPTIPQVNEALLTIKDLGIAMFALVIVALGIVAFIVVNRRNVNSDAVQALRKVTDDYRSVIEDYKESRDRSDKALDEEKRENAAELMSIGEAYNRLVDLKEQDSETLDKLAGIMAELVKSQKYARDEHSKHGALLQGIQDGLSTVLADTPLLPHLEEIKRALVEIKAAIECQPKHDDMAAINRRLDAIQEFLTLDLKEWRERQASAERIQATIDKLPEDEREP